MRSLTTKICALILVVCAMSACTYGPDRIAEFWRPVSEPNILLPLEKSQRKLDFDLSQCRCGIYPRNSIHTDVVEFQPDNQRLAETSVTVTPTPDDNNSCHIQPSLIVSECMRNRGWEITNCSGRMPVAGGGALCASYAIPPDADK